ncbi:hypothetical protein [Mesoplasma melaleucae]|uniref:hypothetical protein n=1 Tax=Mesoplasma melaleucae TaxID=81459 RepID=UPI000488F37C|nr:hypothetical protein [Mesoplasma melaleucae]
MKYDLSKFNISKVSNLIDENQIIDRLNLILGLGSVNETDLSIDIKISKVDEFGIITLKGNKNSEYLSVEVVIQIPKIRNLAEDDLFVYMTGEPPEQKTFIFYEDTKTEDIFEYLQDKKGWIEINIKDISFEVTTSPTVHEPDIGIGKITAVNNLKVGFTYIKTRSEEEQHIEVPVQIKLKELTKVILDPIDLGRIDVLDIDKDTEAKMLTSLKDVLMTKTQNNHESENVCFDELHIKLVDRYNFEVVANEHSEVYSGAIEGSYFIEYDLVNYQKSLLKVC